MLQTQSNTRVGPFTVPANSDLSAKEGYLVVFVDGGTKVSADLPATNADRVIGVLDDANSAGGQVGIVPLSPERNIRVKAKGTGSGGQVLVLADTSTAADKGKLRALPATTGTYYAVAIAEEDFVDGQLVLCRPVSRETIAV